jgi:hypothetical protein
MATLASIQAILNPANQMNIGRITQSISYDGTYDSHYVVSGIGACGVAKWINTTKANTATQQAAEITTALALH